MIIDRAPFPFGGWDWWEVRTTEGGERFYRWLRTTDSHGRTVAERHEEQ